MSTLATVTGWQTPHSIPPFDSYPDDRFRELFDCAFAAAEARIDSVANSHEPPSFANTIEALELASWELERVGAVFFNLVSADSNEARKALEREIAPRYAKFFTSLAMNRSLFARVREIHDSQAECNLSPEQRRVLELYRRDFVRFGAELDSRHRKRFAEIKARLAELQTSFSQNLLSAEEKWTLPLERSDVEDLPEFLVAALSAASQGSDTAEYCLTLNRSLIVPFLQYSKNRALRQRAFEGWCARGAPNSDADNSGLLKEILKLRQEFARLLGYEFFADYKLEFEMAQDPAHVRELLDTVWQPACSQAENDAAVLQRMMIDDGIDDELKPWDWRYYAERRRGIEFNVDEAQAKPYFRLPRMIAAAMDCASRLFGLEFERIEADLYHEDCLAWKVSRRGAHVGTFIGDYLERPSKRSGAWCSSFMSQRNFDQEVRPVVVNVCNFVRPARGQDCLLSFEDTRTLFHEFGHALHALLSDVRYARVSGTSVPLDFVEMPSQLFEHWMKLPEVLTKFATDGDTGMPIPEKLLSGLLAARNFDQGFRTVEYLASAYVDLAFHESDVSEDPLGAERRTLEDIGMPAAIAMRHSACNFAHVFASEGYAAGYYSYLWSEVLDADVFETFLEEGGPFNSETASRLEQCILSKGGSRRPEDLYTEFRGRLPDAGALLRKRGFR
ncbi:MAG: M3 family metallopeptidase [Rhodobacteraceae bacterium]|nr:M3 family metallopeptidase [Paracoccaceae bacterium]